MSLIDALRASWPPHDAVDDVDYVGRRTAGTHLLDACELPASDGIRRAVAVAADPEGQLLLVPLVGTAGAWRRARAGDGLSAALVQALDDGLPVAPGFGLRRLGGPGAPSGERAMGVDQTNESVVVGEAVVVKWLRRPASGPHPAPAVLAHLDEVGYEGTPRPFGALAWTAPDGTEAVLAFVDAYLPDARDGWDWCVDLLLDHLGHPAGTCEPGCEADFADQLGALVAGLHHALATPSSVVPVPVVGVGSADIGAWRIAAEGMLEQALEATDGPEGDELRSRSPRMRAMLARLASMADSSVMRVHGDLHVGQVLRWRGGLALIDFDGNPATDPASAALPQPAARDVAGMVRSLDHVGRVADRQTGHAHAAEIERWVARSRSSFLAAYRRHLAAAGRADLFDERLLQPFEVEQECRELVYAARFLPRWRYAPMAALRAMFPP